VCVGSYCQIALDVTAMGGVPAARHSRVLSSLSLTRWLAVFQQEFGRSSATRRLASASSGRESPRPKPPASGAATKPGRAVLAVEAEERLAPCCAQRAPAERLTTTLKRAEAGGRLSEAGRGTILIDAPL
jgi:hypothetical protein